MTRPARNGSTRAWRKLRAAILHRDPTCQVPTPPAGKLCGQPSTDAGHVVAYTLGGTDHPTNLRGECSLHSKQGGGELRQLLRKANNPR
jgi:5-methylcytosine-specific restriction endonuclease McrA